MPVTEEDILQQKVAEPVNKPKKQGFGCLFILASGTLALLEWFPVAVRVTRMLEIGAAGLILLLIFFVLMKLAFRWPRFGAGFMFLTVAAGAFLATWVIRADKPYSAEALRQEYVTRLQHFKGTCYVWGGERHNGIDCSGLARIALWEAMLYQGVEQRNPRLLEKKTWQFWWEDISARDILTGKYGYTRRISQAERLAGLDTSALKPGDMAVATNGLHVLIFIKNNRWIEANPDDGRVVINEATADSGRHYFNTPVVILRWSWLAVNDKAMEF